MTTSNRNKKRQGAPPGGGGNNNKNKKFCTLENFVSEGMETIGEKNHQALKQNDRIQIVDYLNRNRLRKWKAAYGVRPLVAYDAWLRICKKALLKGISTSHLFWCLHWMKTYGNEDNISRTLGTTPKTFRSKVKMVIKLLSKCMPSVVKWSNRLIDCNQGEMFTITVDGTDCPIQEPKREDGRKGIDKKWYSVKFKGAGLRYEIAVAIYSDNIVWLNGPFPCGAYPDLKIYKEKGLSEKLIEAGEKSVADGTYRHFTVSQKGKGRLSWRQRKNYLRARHETVNNRIKIFDCFKIKWRHSHHLHRHTFQAAVVLTQISFPYNPLMNCATHRK